jgi:hypothetical protein
VLDQPDFLNVCVQIETMLQPYDLLAVCKDIEKALGRQVRERWGPREIDIDILMMQGVDIDTPTLTIPHPRLARAPVRAGPSVGYRAALGVRRCAGFAAGGDPSRGRTGTRCAFQTKKPRSAWRNCVAL